MTINQIECFVEAAKAGSISKAAEFLFITQQAASSQIRALEKELGFRVFERKNRGVSLTPEGELLFEEWQEIQTIYRISVDRARDYHTKRSKNIFIGLEDMGKCSEDIMMAFAAYEKQFPDLHIQSEVMSPRRIMNQFVTGHLDMAIVYESEFQDYTELKCFPLHEKKIDVCLFISREHPLAQKAENQDWTLADLQDIPVGVLGETYSLDFKKKIRHLFGTSGTGRSEPYEIYESRRNLEINLLAGRCVTIAYETMFGDEENRLISCNMNIKEASSRMALFWKEDRVRIKAEALGNILRDKLSRYN